MREMRRLLQQGGAAEPQVLELLQQAKKLEAEGPERTRRNLEALDALLTPMQQAKYRVLEGEVEQRVRELTNRARARGRGRAKERPANPSRSRGAAGIAAALPRRILGAYGHQQEKAGRERGSRSGRSPEAEGGEGEQPTAREKPAAKRARARSRAKRRRRSGARRRPRSQEGPPRGRGQPCREAEGLASRAAARKTPAPRRAAARRAAAPRAVAAQPPRAVPGLSEEDQIRAAKFLPRELPKRLFEEERFLFPESYGQNRIRLLVRDPEWIFAYWDVKPESLAELAKSLGERALALSRLTLRVVDPVSGGSSDILLPPGARWWYVRTDAARRTYRAELGITLPSGQFRRLAESNTVVTPRVGPSAERARRRMSYRDAGELAPADAAAAIEAEREADLASEPWAAESVDGGAPPARRRARRAAPRAVERATPSGPEARATPSNARRGHARRVLVPRPPRAPAVRPPSRVPGLPRGGLVLRGAHRDLRPDRAGARRPAARRRRLPADDDAVAAARLDDDGRAADRALPPAPRRAHRAGRAARWSARGTGSRSSRSSRASTTTSSGTCAASSATSTARTCSRPSASTGTRASSRSSPAARPTASCR